MARQKGFSLFEIMMVLVILGGLMAVGLGRINRNQKNVRTIMREMSVLGKEIRHRARLKNQTMRLVLDMPEKGPHRYWIEFATGPVLAVTDAKKKKNLSSDEQEKEKAASPFKKDESLLKKDKELPNGLFFGQVESVHVGEAISVGTAYVHFLPQGLVEEAGIQITDRKNFTWTLVFNPLTGQSDVVEEAYSVINAKK